MTKSAPQRRSRITKVLDFFRTGEAEEIRAVMYLMNGIIAKRRDITPDETISVDVPVRRWKRRGNGADVNSSANSQPERAEGANA